MRKNSPKVVSSDLPPDSAAGTHHLDDPPSADPASTLDLGPIGHKVSIKPREACDALSIGPTKLYELLNTNELVSYREDGSRKILVSSIRVYIARRIAASKSKTTLAAMLLVVIASKLLGPIAATVDVAPSMEMRVSKPSYEAPRSMAFNHDAIDIFENGRAGDNANILRDQTVA